MDRLKQIFSSVLQVPLESVNETLSPETAPSWDSLSAIILITEIEKEFKITFTFDEAMAVRNFSEVISLVQSKGAEL
jgi:acyl carrier protein